MSEVPGKYTYPGKDSTYTHISLQLGPTLAEILEHICREQRLPSKKHAINWLIQKWAEDNHPNVIHL